MTSFGVNGNSSNDASASWNSGHANLSYLATPINNNNYFTAYNRVLVISGDGTADPLDWVVFNFGIQNGNNDFDGYNTTLAYFGGESTYSGGTGGLNMTIGRVWGFNVSSGWTLLYQLPLPGDSTYNHTNGAWFTSGSTVDAGHGKRAAYDSTLITHIGFSVV